MNGVEIPAIGKYNRWNSKGPLSLDQTITVRATVDVCAHGHYSRNSGKSSSKASLCLHNAEAFVIVEEFWLLFNLISFFISKSLSDLFLSLEEHIDLIESTRILRAEEVGYITRFLIIIRH